MQFSLQMLHDPESWGQSVQGPCISCSQWSFTRNRQKKKNYKKPQTETVTVVCPLQPSIFGDFYSEIYTHSYISMKFNWKWCKGNCFSYKIRLMTRYICLHEHKIFQYNRINIFFSFNLKISEHLAKFFNYITYVLSCCLQFIISVDILIFFKPPSST